MNTTPSETKRQVSIPLHPDLRPVLDAITDKHLTYLATRQGQSRSSKAFTNYVIDAAKDADLPPHRSAHGLRKAICVRRAEVGYDAITIMSITGHQNLAVGLNRNRPHGVVEIRIDKTRIERAIGIQANQGCDHRIRLLMPRERQFHVPLDIA